MPSFAARMVEVFLIPIWYVGEADGDCIIVSGGCVWRFVIGVSVVAVVYWDSDGRWMF